MVTHDPIAASYADRIIFLGDGKIVTSCHDPPRSGSLSRCFRGASRVNGSVASFRANRREHGASVTVAALSSGFGVLLLQVTGMLATYINHQQLAQHGTTQAALTILAVVFLVISIYVGSIVTTNTIRDGHCGPTEVHRPDAFGGATSQSLRASVAGEGFVVGIIGALVGAGAGLVLSLAALAILVGTRFLPQFAYPLVNPYILAPIVVVVLTTWAASWVEHAGSSRSRHWKPSDRLANHQSGRPGAALCETLLRSLCSSWDRDRRFGSGTGSKQRLRVAVAFFAGSDPSSDSRSRAPVHALDPAPRRPSLRRKRPAKLAAQNSLRYPERSARTTIGLVIGVALVTTLTVASQTFAALIQSAQAGSPQLFPGATAILAIILPTFGGLIGFSIIIAAVEKAACD